MSTNTMLAIVTLMVVINIGIIVSLTMPKHYTCMATVAGEPVPCEVAP